MPRPVKCRKVCSLPDNSEFYPSGCKPEIEPIILNVDEYETIRLIDKEGFSQEECSEHMHIARTTVQQIYCAARKKISIALVEGLPIKISGGNYKLCDGKGDGCGHKGCHRRNEEK